MYIDKLDQEIKTSLYQATEAWIAVALMSQYGLELIKGCKCRVNILVGIDLPTPPNVLRDLLSLYNDGKVNFRLYANTECFFHPKFYLFNINGTLKGYVGSGNFTKGGLNDNIELFLNTDNRNQCNSLLNWFELYFQQGIIINEAYITTYETKAYSKLKDIQQNYKKDLQDILESQESDHNQFFRLEHFKAFSGNKPITDTEQVKRERKNVKLKFMELHDKLFPLLKANNLNVFPHHSTQHIVSSHYHNPRVSKKLSGMWLSYGKSPDEFSYIKSLGGKDKHNENIRLQVIIRENFVGFWCSVGKPNESRLDRENLYKKTSNEAGLLKFYDLLKGLGEGFYINIVSKPVQISALNSMGTLRKLIEEDFYNTSHYFIIGIDIPYGDPRLSEDHILNFSIEVFKLLYPIYAFIKA